MLDGQYNCSEVIQASFASQDGTGCYAYSVMIGCFTVSPLPALQLMLGAPATAVSCAAAPYPWWSLLPACCGLQIAPEQWGVFLGNCDTIFSAAPNCAAQGTAWADCSRPDDPTTQYVTGLNDGHFVNTVNTYQYSTGYLDNAGQGWQSAIYTGNDGVSHCAVLLALRLVLFASGPSQHQHQADQADAARFRKCGDLALGFR